ncbi:MAG: ATP-binding protein [Cryobacterium sp.]|nr:ATP-binding protein [Cryobacterium sp.]
MTYWLPSTEADILSAIAAGVIGESQHLDVKLTYAAQDPNVNTKLAQDLAAFAVDGGAILVGVRQDGETFAAEPQPLADIDALAERISQVSRDKPSPPIFAPTRVIPSEADAGRAYLLIEIPPSPSAPHSVDGGYWGRGDRANRRLVDDREVDRLVRARVNVARLAADMLGAELPDPLERPEGAVLCVVAEPAQAHDDEALLRLLPEDPDRHPHRGVDGAVWEIVSQNPGLPIRWDDGRGRQLSDRDRFPGTDGLTSSADVQRRALGRVVGGGTRARRRNEIELREHGGIRLVREGLTQSRVLRAQFSGDEDVELKAVDDPGIVSSVWRVLGAAIELGRRIGYRGSWSFAVHVEGIDDSIAAQVARNVDDQLDLGDRPRYDQEVYERSTSATTVELEGEPVRVLYRLVGRLVRGLNVEDLYSRWIDGWPGETAP